MASATVRLQALDGFWETVGKDRLTGIFPEGISASANAWGSDTCRFMLRRDPRAVHPDLAAFTPCEIEVDGVVVWSGRVWETPSKDGPDESISVEGRGWQYHLDDDVYSRMFVHTKLSEYVDLKSLVTMPYTAGVWTANEVVSGEGAITLQFPAGSTHTAAARFATAVLDLGPDSRRWAKRVVVTLDMVAGLAATDTFLVWGDDNGTFASPGELAITSPSPPTATTYAGNFTTARRYVYLYLRYTPAVTTTLTADKIVRVAACKVFSNTAYESGNVSILKASDVIKDALPYAPLLSQATTRINNTTFSIPEFEFIDSKTPREVISAVNAYHNYRTRVDVDQTLRFEPLPTAPKFEIGNADGVAFEDASANSGETIYNRVSVEGTGPDGSPIRLTRTVAQLYPYGPLRALTSPTPSNPSADTVATGWVRADGTTTNVTRDTTTFHTSPASMKHVADGQSFGVSITGTLKAYKAYVVQFAAKVTTAVGGEVLTIFVVPATNRSKILATETSPKAITTAWQVFEVPFVVPEDTSNAEIHFRGLPDPGIGSLWIDSVVMNERLSTMPDRRNFTRTSILPVSSAITNAVAAQLGDVYLANHQSTPLRGSMTVTRGGLRTTDSSYNLHPSQLLSATGELVRFTDRTDPDTGALGRDGRIASVNYDHTAESASVEIDNERRNFEALLGRLAVLAPA